MMAWDGGDGISPSHYCYGRASNALYSHDFEGLMENLSAAFPSITFYVRGIGEEYGTVWLRQFRGGKTTARTGPFENE
jgi:hypothetical protein